MDNPSVFISYNHKSSSIVEHIVTKLDSINAKVFWDRRLGPWKSFKEFMDKIGKQDYVVAVISEAYLKSPYCAYEVVQLMKVENWDKKTMFVVEESRIYDSVEERVKYVDYWADQVRKYKVELTKHDPAAVSDIAEEMEKCDGIRLHIGKFLKVAADFNNPNIYDAIDAILDRIKISAKRNSSEEIETEIVGLVRSGINTTHSIAIATNRATNTIKRYIVKLEREGKLIRIGTRMNVKLEVAYNTSDGNNHVGTFSNHD